MRLNISFDDQDRTLYAELNPSEEPEEVSFLSILGKVEEAGYKNLTLNPKTISELQASAQQGKECKIALKTLIDATASMATLRAGKRDATS